MARKNQNIHLRSSETTAPESLAADTFTETTKVEKMVAARPEKPRIEKWQYLEQKEIVKQSLILDDELARALVSAYTEQGNFDRVERLKIRLTEERELREGATTELMKIRDRKDADETAYRAAVVIKTKKEKKERLEEIEERGDLVVRNEVIKIEVGVEGARRHEAVFKPRDGEPLRYADDKLLGTVTGDQEPRGYLREWLAGFVAKALEREELVPPTVIREVGERIGSVQKWVDGELASEGKNWILKSKPDDLEALAALDYILEIRDRHKANFFIDEKGRVTAIDHGLTLSIEEGHSIRSFPLRLYGEKEISPSLRSLLESILSSEPRRLALQKAFNFAFGDEGTPLFGRFSQRVRELTKNGMFPKYELSATGDKNAFGLDIDSAENPQIG
ncbi:hypothetical protein A3F28_03695 [Candidatus Uhrbacteria bacterium RIFCSPHIGHO2_12_FULL_57_11]|uniref:PI3K/PI4K catalytic domain-containing protein n=2 Tax=Candidatus Uhriibacteriota TaxID=1752732 RepID=A0A1F7UNU0_9BACT|nr:MAG: hypothetical protein A3D72_03000 [Candidatus Uhrbacteria bacterium RIFCSPHIGHO2_02_FULL_57_19]OGL79424.1 MAG: hypothetical protein A3F28_03695 [Candidatus Uhrbacteria bacterium RIFCSPHIGHO2_12_FULL_57_11]